MTGKMMHSARPFLSATLSCVALMALGIGTAHAQKPGDPFAGVTQFSKGATEVKNVDLDKDAMRVAAGMNDSGFTGMNNMDDVSVHEYGFPRAGMYDMAAVKHYADTLQSTGWKQMVYKQEDGEVKEVATREVDGGEMHELAVLKAEPKELKFVYLRYHGTLAGMESIPGMGDSAPNPKLQQRQH